MIPLFLSLVDNWEYKASLKLMLQFLAEYHSFISHYNHTSR